jgi:hypothetical protein
MRKLTLHVCRTKRTVRHCLASSVADKWRLVDVASVAPILKAGTRLGVADLGERCSHEAGGFQLKSFCGVDLTVLESPCKPLQLPRFSFLIPLLISPSMCASMLKLKPEWTMLGAKKEANQARLCPDRACIASLGPVKNMGIAAPEQLLWTRHPYTQVKHTAFAA